MPVNDSIGQAKEQIMANELSELVAEFQRTGNISVMIAFTDGVWGIPGDTGHAQLVLVSGDKMLAIGFSPEESNEDLKLTLGMDVPGVLSIEPIEPDAILSSKFIFNGPPAAQLIDGIASRLADPNQTYHTLFNSCITMVHDIVRDYGINVYAVRDELGISGPIASAPQIPDTGTGRGYVITDNFNGPNQEVRFYNGDGSQVDALMSGGQTGLWWWDTTGQLEYNVQIPDNTSPLDILIDVNNKYDWGVRTVATAPDGGHIETTKDVPNFQGWDREVKAIHPDGLFDDIVVNDDGAVAATTWNGAALVGDFGQMFGSRLGHFLGGNTLVGQLAAGTVMGAVGKEVGNALTAGANFRSTPS